MAKRGGDGDQPFEVRLGRIRAPSGHAKTKSFFRQVRRSAQHMSQGKRGYRQTRGQMAAQFQCRVLVKVHVQSMAKHGAAVQSQHLKYIQRGSAARQGEEGRVFDASSDDADAQSFEDRRAGDRHQFRVIVSPEDGGDLSDLKAYTRDLVSNMEHDLGTKLDWVAADHYDTGQPHVHLVIGGKRDDGQDLVIPKRYIAHGIRGRAQELVELELGPVQEIDGRQRMASMVQQERFTDLDRQLAGNTHGTVIDLTKMRQPLQPWRAQLLKQRLKTLEGFGLVEPLGKGRWHIAPDAAPTLTRMGARGDIIKAMHRAMNRQGRERVIDGAAVFDPCDEKTRAVTGQIIALGVADDVRDQAFMIIDGVDGKTTYLEIGSTDRLVAFERGQMVQVHPPSFEPRPSDQVIDEVGRQNGGRYSADLHMDHDPKARPAFVEAHVRRLEAMRRAGHATRHDDGTWSLPPDYLSRAARFERSAALKKPLQIEQLSKLTLRQMVVANGSTWLDVMQIRSQCVAAGFGKDVREAFRDRQAVLFERGFIKTPQAQVTDSVRQSLLQADLADASKALSADLEKPYRKAPQSGLIKGHYLKAIDRPSGRFAVIERARDFTLVPWRDVMDRRLGQSIAGHVHRGQVSWTITQGKTLPPL